MLITYCSNDTSKMYGESTLAVEAGFLEHEDLALINERYAHVVALEVDPDSVFGTPSALVIEIVDGVAAVRPKNEIELVADMKPAKLEEILAGADAALRAITSDYGEYEKLSWSKQEEEARELMKDANAEAGLLRQIAEYRRVPLETLRDKVLANVTASEQATGYILGLQQRYGDMLKAATTVAEVEAIEVNYAF